MHDLRIKVEQDAYWIAANDDNSIELYLISDPLWLKEFLKGLHDAIHSNEDFISPHLIIKCNYQNNKYLVCFGMSSDYKKGYLLSKSKLVSFKNSIAGALNG